MYRYLILLTASSMLGLQAWQTMFNNFAVDVASLDGNHVGMIQTVREIPGLLALLAIFVMRVMHEHSLAAFSIIILGAGMAITGLFPSYPGLLATTLFMSFGFHYYETANQSLTLQYFDSRSSPKVLGKQRSLGALSNIFASAIIFFIAGVIDYSHMYIFFGLIIIAAGVWALSQNPSDSKKAKQHKKFIMKRKYTLFYILTFLAGARRQIFIAFAGFLLVKNFHYSIKEIAALFVINNVINYFLSPVIGRAIVRFGERRIMTLEYLSLILIFLSYAYTDSRVTAGALYILDNIFLNFNITVNTYFQKIGAREDIAPSMAIGFTINHIAAVIIPVTGGILWLMNYRIPFITGACLCAVSLFAAQFIKTKEI